MKCKAKAQGKKQVPGPNKVKNSKHEIRFYIFEF